MDRAPQDVVANGTTDEVETMALRRERRGQRLKVALNGGAWEVHVLRPMMPVS